MWWGEGVGSCYALKDYYGRDQLDCPPLNGLNHYFPLNKTGAHSTGERFRATMALLFDHDIFYFYSTLKKNQEKLKLSFEYLLKIWKMEHLLQ